METRTIGALPVSVVGLGCNNFGMRIDADQTKAVVAAALDNGITLFDTADIYGRGLSEEFLGKALKGHRDEVIIATKFGMPMDDDPAHRGASAKWIGEAVDASLRRLGVDHIDVYQQHAPDADTPIEETLETLNGLVRAGKVRKIGNSNFSAEQIEEAAGVASDRDWARFVSAQNELNMLRRKPLDDVIPACEQFGLGFLPYFPLASGLLTGKYQRGQDAPEGTRLAGLPEDRAERVFSDRNFDRIERLTAFAASRDRTLLDLAFAWLLAQPTMASVIAGATEPEQVRANANAVSWQLTGDELGEVQEVLSGT